VGHCQTLQLLEIDFGSGGMDKFLFHIQKKKNSKQFRQKIPYFRKISILIGPGKTGAFHTDPQRKTRSGKITSLSTGSAQKISRKKTPGFSG